MALKRIYIVRHGKYSRQSGELIEEGEGQVKEAAVQIASEVAGGREKVVVFHTNKIRARESAEIVNEKVKGKLLQISDEKDINLFLGWWQGLIIIDEQGLAFVEALEATIVVCVTHLNAFRKLDKLGEETGMEIENIEADNGGMLGINLETKKATYHGKIRKKDG